MRFPPPPFSQQNPLAPQSQFRLTVNVEGNRGMFAPIHPTMPSFPPPQHNPNDPYVQFYNSSHYPNTFNQQQSPVMFPPTNQPYQPYHQPFMFNPSQMYNPFTQTGMMHTPSSSTSLMFNPYTYPIPRFNQPMLALPPPKRGTSSTTTITEINSDNEADSEVAEGPRAAPSCSKASLKMNKDTSTGKRPFTRSSAKCDDKVKVVMPKNIPNVKQCKPKDAEELHAHQASKKCKIAANKAYEEEEVSETGEAEEDNDVEEDNHCRWMDGEESSEEDQGDSDFEDTPAPVKLTKDCPKSKAKKSLSLQKGSDALRAQAASLQKWLDEEDDSPSRRHFQM